MGTWSLRDWGSKVEHGILFSVLCWGFPKVLAASPFRGSSCLLSVSTRDTSKSRPQSLMMHSLLGIMPNLGTSVNLCHIPYCGWCRFLPWRFWKVLRGWMTREFCLRVFNSSYGSGTVGDFFIRIACCTSLNRMPPTLSLPRRGHSFAGYSTPGLHLKPQTVSQSTRLLLKNWKPRPEALY